MRAQGGVIIDLVTDAGDGAFEPVLSYLGWWDCPRSGVALVHGQPYYFVCRFSEELDDYPDEFCLWPIAGDELEDETQGRCGTAGGISTTRDCGRALSQAIRRLKRWIGRCAAANVSHRQRRGRLSPSGALTLTARSQGAFPCIWSAGRSLADAG
jgi:hypothetical protein